MILSFFRKDAAFEAGEALYAAAVEQARTPALYACLGAPDTVEGRFEMVAIHVWLVMRRLKQGGPGVRKVSQAMFDAMFRNLDDSLRELGVGDLSVGKKIRKLAENFYGRIGAYETALASRDESELAAALGLNVFEKEDAPAAKDFADYVRRAAAAIEDQPTARIAGGIVRFPDPVEAS